MGHNLGQDAKLKRGAKRGVESRMKYGVEHGTKCVTNIWGRTWGINRILYWGKTWGCNLI